MSYFASNPNLNHAVQQTAKNHLQRVLLQNQLILQTISVALTNSINNYQKAILTAACTTSTQQSQVISKSDQQPQLSTQNSNLKLTQIQQSLQKQNLNVPKSNLQVAKKKPQKKRKELQTQSTSQELAQQVLQKTGFKQQERSLKKSSQTTVKMENNSISPLPITDMVQAAYLPPYKMQQLEKDRIREFLLEREVDEWNNKIKGRRDKRQLRLLS